jgi:hypothetical protein
MHDYITIYQVAKSSTQRLISSKSKFFEPNEDLIVIVTNEKIIIRKPSIDYSGKTHKAIPNHSGWVTFVIVADLPLMKKLEPDEEESDEDQAVYYYNE